MPHDVSTTAELLWRLGIVGLIGLGVWVVLRSGRIMLGNAAFAAIGAATTAALIVRGTPSVAAIVAGVAVASISGALFGFVVARVSATAFAIASLALWAVELSVRAPDGATLHSDASPLPVIIAAIAAVVATWFYAKSRPGLAAAALAQDERAAEGVGVDPVSTRILAVAYASLLAGTAGSLSVLYPGFDVTAYRIHGDIAALAAVVVGGVGSVFGPLIGAALVAIGAVTPLTKQHAAAVNAVALLAATIVLPGGLASLVSRSGRR